MPRQRLRAQRTITLSHELNATISATKEINWSDVAARAFEETLRIKEIAVQPGEKIQIMQDNTEAWSQFEKWYFRITGPRSLAPKDSKIWFPFWEAYLAGWERHYDLLCETGSIQ